MILSDDTELAILLFRRRPVGSPARRGAPDGGGGDVAEAEEGVARGLHMRGRQGQLLLHAVDDPAPARVDAEVLKGPAEVRHVRLDLHAQHLQWAAAHHQYCRPVNVQPGLVANMHAAV